ncbi:hypothetical protein [Streptomyces noursei]|uniref:Conjugal transfer protein TrbC n=2 Tax=Streptomyces noursei TaxID=1971 RepID=A0A401QRP3_STRNR|nr:hypothetical protein [Streptomyces noursei]EXU86571.1 hypothetical protein P354_41515 [Streptomyces noursei PD-1]UWS77538.1 hypothetical protein N1H47_40735 [Streptomyces noursei]GCB88025.1 hypothetical protein SALB_00694 [Streptomyces noursei]
MSHWLNLASDILAAPNPKPSTGWDAPPSAPPGMETVFPEWIGWGKWIAIGLGILGLIACGIMMMIGRRNRSHLSAEGANGLLWVMGGLSVVSLAAGVVPAVIGG